MDIFKKFINYYKPYKLLFFADMFCALVVSAVDISFPVILSYLSKNFFTKDKQVILHNIGYIGIALVCMYIIKYFCQYFIATWGHIMGARMENNMRRDLFSHLQSLPFSYYDENNTGEMMSKLISDLFDISELAHHGPENVLISALKILGSFTILLFINVKMTLILLVVTVVMVVFSTYQNLKMRKIFLDNRKKTANINSAVQDSLSGIRVVKSFANEEIEKKKFNKRNKEYLNSKVQSYTAMGKFIAGNTFFEGILYVAIIVAGSLFIIDGSLKVSDLVVYALYINIFINPIDILINFTELFQKGYAGFQRFREVIETVPVIVDKEDAVILTNVKGNIEYKNVTFSYGDDHNVLNDISIKIEAGRNIAFVGPSGGGKTTICSLLPRFYDITSGSITIDGNDIRDLTLESLRNSIGVVQQDVYMFAGSIKENIGYGKINASDEEIMEAAKNANIHDYIMDLDEGYDTYVGERGVKLSGGQKQRLSIARVFLKNPPILILDEATSALDNESERYIQSSIEKLSKDRTTIVIAHRLSTIKKSDEIIVINDEGIQERGSHSELLKNEGMYAYYYNMQFEGLDSNSKIF
ncbi:ABC transporter ATP-binding protein/permease [Clostridium tagluense]|uniref:ABC transporter ATP-binding protein n=1 Tax=Clostridium tagluense TaxID=360422 RepID=UPI001CF54468|nr:ABC transporter ATP-binding protein [Clostridium tagluense]MCB2313441.1 ABC transporter ATP-binding protein/permease [Clostridium tagluense]MCB2318292.1 ABC transporter ATP-binding protein/permease [Clostridium tagluense]MCB2323093.1 ABC transporter ATP-binding protein/permease [Clostridium tagluense]MCB2328076.1 ABC transporter ATP-binding protein/permease [Clostridium tagluense]MCB2332768.1 ABC transporter ATP-binding protein/permease [Clostridium tagluense]